MAEMDMNSDSIIWNDTEYKLKFVLDNPNFNLPQVVRVVQGHMVDEDDSIASGQVITLHGKRKIESFIGTDGNGKKVNIPFNCPYKVKVIALGNSRKFTSVNELCFCENPPKYVRLEEDLITGNDTILEAHSTLEILEHMLSEDGVVIGINCRVDLADKETITLPMNLQAVFLETISTESANKYFLLSDLQKDYTLPIQVQFLPINDRNCGYGPQLGEISLQKKLSTNSILATSVIEGIRHAITFSADLPITIQVAKGILNNRPFPEAQENIDLKKFDFFTTSDPYSSNTIQDKIYDDLQTPLLPRRDLQLQRQNSNFSNYSTYSTQKLARREFEMSFVEEPTTHERRIHLSETKKKNKSIDLGKDFEKFVKSKLNFKSLKKFKIKSKDKNEKKEIKPIEIDYDTESTSTFVTSDDRNSSTGLSSIDIRSNESDSTFNSSFHRIAECMDAMSLDNQNVPQVPRRIHSSIGSNDSGICVSGRKQNRNRSRSRSRLTSDTRSTNPMDSTFDALSEWSLPIHLKDSPMSERKSMASLTQHSSASYLWSTETTTNNNNNNNTKKNEEYSSNQNFMAINNYTSQNDAGNNIESSPDIKSSLTKAHVKSMEEIRNLNEEGVAHILELLKLDDFKETFRNNQINGELLLDLELEDLLNELNLSLFQAKKIIKYVKGWRPESKQFQPSETSRRNSLNPRDWSENDVFIHMTTINLIELGRFCQANQVNGDLLLDILDKETLLSLKNDHNVNTSSLECKKLLNFVVKGWRPDSSPKKSAAI